MATYRDVVRRRLWTQGLMDSRFTGPAGVVAWLGAVQAQDYFGAMWAIGQRACGLTAAEADRAFNAGEILRTHILRPTWHFVTPADIRWMLTLSAPRVHQFNAFVYRKVGLDRATLAKTRRVIERALTRDRQLTRTELCTALVQARIEAANIRLAYIVMHEELQGVIVSGPRRGKQFTYALLDDRVPSARTISTEEALAELTRRYVTAHGPATIRDYVWWSGLTVKEAKRGLEMIANEVESEIVDGLTYWRRRDSKTPSRSTKTSAFLLPNYDEALIAYRDRGAPVSGRTSLLNDRGVPHHLIIDGRLAGAWGRTLGTKRATIDVAPYGPLTALETAAVKREAARYGRFLGLPVDVTFRTHR